MSLKKAAGVTVLAAAALAAFVVVQAQEGGKEGARGAAGEVEVVDWESLPESAPAPECEDCGDVVKEYTAEADDDSGAEALQCVERELFTVKGWPEFKVTTEKQCRKVFGRKICVNIPRAWQRNCELKASVKVCHPNAEAMRQKIQTAVKEAVAAGIVTGVLTENPAAAAAAMKAYLVSKLPGNMSQLSVTIKTNTKCGDWKPR